MGRGAGGTPHDPGAYLGTFNFGGRTAGVPVTDPAFVRFASLSMELLGPGRDCRADCTGDGVVDVRDFFAFVLSFVSLNPADPCANCNDDAVVDVQDFFCFVEAFARGCG